jgi:putative CocE/NonD family hydrolase
LVNLTNGSLKALGKFAEFHSFNISKYSLHLDGASDVNHQKSETARPQSLSDIPEPFGPYLELPPAYPSMQVYSVYIPTRDGTRLAADVYLPAPLAHGTRLPTILEQTRYWRSTQYRPPVSWFFPKTGEALSFFRKEKAFFTSHGYAMLVVDVRGTGASFGVWRFPWEPVTVLDTYDIIDWIVQQSWSDGLVAGYGLSYPGNCAELLLATEHPAVKAVVPQFNHPDPFTDIGFPGGLLNERFVRAWGQMDINLDLNLPPESFSKLMQYFVRGVRPVNGRLGSAELKQAVSMHHENGKLHGLPAGLVFRDDKHPLAGFSADDEAPVRYAAAIQSSNVPVLGWASWMDAGTGQAALRRYLTYAGPQRAVIGAWNHGGIKVASPYLPEDIPLSPRLSIKRREILRFFNGWMKPDVENAPESALIYYTSGSEDWHATHQWPPHRIEPRTWYFSEGRRLLPQEPTGAGEDVYAVDFRATSGVFNRWWELGVAEGRSVNYNDRSTQSEFVLSYETDQLERDIEMSGSPVLTLFVDSSEPDSAFYAYLEDVCPDGKILCIDEGELRAVHRKQLDPPSAYFANIPYHSFCQLDALPLEPGKVGDVSFALLPMSVVVRRGHRLRLSLAGHDDGNFERVPPNGQPVWKIQRSREHPSRLTLPIRWP